MPGESLGTADTLSRAPVPEKTLEGIDLGDEVQLYVDAVMDSIPATEERLESIRLSQDQDEALKLVKTYRISGWPEKSSVDSIAKPYYSVASELTIERGLLMRGSRVVIPKALRPDMLSRLHEGHQGINKCREQAKHSTWWPGLSNSWRRR